MDANEFINKNFPTIITGLLGLLAWANEKRRNNSSNKEVDGKTFRLMQEAYETFAKDTNEKLIDLKAELSLVRKELIAQKSENSKLREELGLLRSGVNFTPSIGEDK